ncbi:hypothetical protein FSP39_017200 [Pinctada imbricata]|uniref:Cation efflux protein transmembrane domain-containing protein n=1 Tax=Pinctada imbricata TaxID=66713 RepID=A0AA89C892_PINIB|nr:hypothetical protein FSP39_017200 [Pinctada imbricata]
MQNARALERERQPEDVVMTSDAGSDESADSEAFNTQEDMSVNAAQASGTVQHKHRKFYRRQSQLLQSYQEIDTGRDDKIERYNLLQKKVDLYAKLSFGANVLLLLCKSTAAVLSGSMAIITSLVDSVVDLASGVVVWWTNNKVRRTDPRKYPRGRRRMESLAVIILSVIMGVASLYMIKEAAVKVVALAEETRGPPTVDFVTIGISIFTIVIKLVLYLLCRRVRSPTVQALAQDHRNDVFSNTLAIACGYIGSQQVLDRFRYRPLIYVDPVGAILISLYIAITWYKTGCEQSNNIVGKTACHQTISKVTWLCINFDHRIISVANVFAYNSGFYHIVEVELSLPAEMNVMEFIDLSTALKQKLECVEGIETAYVTASPISELPNRI